MPPNNTFVQFNCTLHKNLPHSKTCNRKRNSKRNFSFKKSIHMNYLNLLKRVPEKRMRKSYKILDIKYLI